MDPVSSEMLTRGEPVKGQGNIAVGPVSLDTAQCAMCVTKIMREVGGLSEMVPPLELAHTFNGEDAFRIATDQKQLYSLDVFPGSLSFSLFSLFFLISTLTNWTCSQVAS